MTDDTAPRRATISDVAKEAGVGVATVDRVINARARVRPDTAKRVLIAAEKLGFRDSNLIRERVRDTALVYKLGFLLQKRSSPFYRHLALSLSHACRQATGVTAEPVFEHSDEINPRILAQSMEDLAERCHAIALVVADHPHVNEAIARLTAQGKPVIALLSDVSAPERSGCVGYDNRKAGRTAAWLIHRTTPASAKVGIVMGSHRFQGQELAEVSFRSYFRENAPDFQIVETIASLENAHLAREASEELLERHPDLSGLYCCCGGVDGVIEALRAKPHYSHIVTVCNEITETTRSALIDGIVDMVISHALPDVSARAVDLMIRAIDNKTDNKPERIELPFDIAVPENV